LVARLQSNPAISSRVASVRGPPNSENHYRNQRGAEGSVAKVCLDRPVERKAASLIATEVDRGSSSGIKKRDCGDRDRRPVTVVDESDLHSAYSAADANSIAGIGNETHEDLPATGEQKRYDD
jgi:hypothetical protein